MNLRCLLLTLLLCTGNLFSAAGQSAPVSINVNVLRNQANKMAQAMVHKDYKTFVKYAHPVLIQRMGGEAKMIKTLAAAAQNNGERGYVLTTFNINNVMKVVKAGNELHALLSDISIMDGDLGTLTVNSYLLAISKDNGQNWLFVDAGALTVPKAKALFPNYNPELKIPVTQKPLFVRKVTK